MSEKAIEVFGLAYSYPDGTAALEGVDLEVQVGETVAVIGPNGAGKTTLLLHLNGLLRGSGTVRVLEMEVEPRNLRQVRSEVGLVFEDPNHQLFMPTVFEDVAFGPLNQGASGPDLPKIVADALAKVGMEGAEERSPHRLSLGEKRRVALATVLAMEPKILVLDEPLNGLDPKGRRDILELIAGLPQTKIIATHDLEMVLRICQRVFLLDKGRIVAQGPASTLLADETLMEAHSLEVPPSLRAAG
jgi:energy-coupling factor transporter ATP-binding protein EcfA2